MQAQRREDVVTGVLDRMERHARMIKLAILGAAGLEGLLLVVALLIVDWADSTHVLLFVLSILCYTIIGLRTNRRSRTKSCWRRYRRSWPPFPQGRRSCCGCTIWNP